MKLSVAMIVKNEEKNLSRCLDSLLPIKEYIELEIIIVDTGSTDSTLDIARSYTDMVFFHEWNNDFAAMRNKSISYATGDWVLVVDADEVLTDCKEIVNFLMSKETQKYKTVCMNFKNITDVENDYFGMSLLARLFLNTPKLKYKGRIHEQPVVSFPVKIIETVVEHYGYVSNDKELMDYKFERNVKMIEEELKNDPKNIYMWYQLSCSYGMYKDFEKALESNLHAYNIAKAEKVNLREKMYVYTHLAFCYFKLMRFEELEQICEEGVSVEEGYIDLHFYLGYARLKLDKNTLAIHNFKRYLDFIEKNNYSGKNDPSVSHHSVDWFETAYKILTVLYVNQKCYDTARGYLAKITDKKIIISILDAIIAIYCDAKEYGNLKKYIDNVLLEKKQQEEFVVMLEKRIANLKKEDKKNVNHIFSEYSEKYSALLRIRSNKNLTVEEINEVDYDHMPELNPEIIDYIIKNRFPMPMISLESLRYSLNIFLRSYDESIVSYINYLREHSNIKNSTLVKEISFSLLKNNQDMENYNHIFEIYLDTGIKHMKLVYNIEQLNLDQIFLLDKQDSFLALIYLFNSKDKKIGKVRLLKKALKICPELKRGVEYLLSSIQQKQGLGNESINKDMLKIKDNIKTLISNGNLDDGKYLLDEYRKLSPRDIDIYSIQAVVYISEGKLNEAEKVIKEGLDIEPNNFDLLYNKAFLHQSKGEYTQALSYYNKALNNAKTENEVSDCKAMIDELKDQKSESDTLDDLESKFKTNIQSLIEQGMISDAKELLVEYQKMAPDDVDVYCIKGIIAMAEANYAEAERVLKLGLVKNKGNNDLLFNIAYLYNIRKEYSVAKRFISRAKQDESMKKLEIEILANMNDCIESGIETSVNELGKNLNPKVTIVIPTYNQKRHLRETLLSCLAQDYPNLEIVVGDDSSTDGTEEMMREFQKHLNVRYVRHSKNLGPGVNSTYLIYNEVDSKYTMILNHDDYFIKTNYISQAVKLMERNKNLSFVWAVFVN